MNRTVTATVDTLHGETVTVELSVSRAVRLGCGCERLECDRPGGGDVHILHGAHCNPQTRRGDEIRVGDVLLFLGNPHTVTELRPYVGSLLGVLGAGARIATCEPGWAITLPSSQRFTVAS